MILLFIVCISLFSIIVIQITDSTEICCSCFGIGISSACPETRHTVKLSDENTPMRKIPGF